jgi:tRNA-dihydrouridine synthase B
VLADHLQDLYAFYGEDAGVRIARKHIDWYTRDLAGSEEFRRGMNQLESAQQQMNAVDAFFGRLAQHNERLSYWEEGLAA